MKVAIRDQAVTLGRRGTMVGIVTQPVNHVPGELPAFVILNTGLIHRIGHHRMFVTLARRLAAAGHQVLRFDLSGIGDSESRGEALSPLESTLADIGEAIEWIAKTGGARRFILLGLCSGADHALVYGRSDPRVVGLVLLDPSIPPTRQYHVRYVAGHLVRARSWLDLFCGRGRFWNTVRRWAGDRSDELWERHRLRLGDPEVRTFLEKAYQDAMELGIQCLAVFTSGFPHQHNYRRQLLDAFPRVRFAGSSGSNTSVAAITCSPSKQSAPDCSIWSWAGRHRPPSLNQPRSPALSLRRVGCTSLRGARRRMPEMGKLRRALLFASGGRYIVMGNQS